MPFALYVLAFSVFSMGAAEFIVAGLAPIIAESLGVPLSSVGLLVTFFAIGLTVGPPLVGVLTRRFKPKALLAFLLVTFVLANVVGAATNILIVILAMRLLMGVAFGIFVGMSVIMASHLVSPEKQTSAISLILFGFVIALVAGLPAGRWIGETFGWKASFISIAILATIAFAGVLVFMPTRPLSPPTTASGATQMGVLTSVPLIKVYVMTFCSLAAFACVFTYVAPFLQAIAKFEEGQVTLILLVFGIAAGAGNFSAGKLGAMLGTKTALIACYVLLCAVLVLMHSLTNSSALLVLLLMFGALTFAISPLLYSHIIDIAVEQYKKGSEDMASGINISVVSLGLAFGAYAGGLVIDRAGLGYVAVLGCVFVLIALVFTLLNKKLAGRTGA